MKYYIDDKLVRTSDRTYTHAVLSGEAVIACCGSHKLAIKEMNRRIGEWNSRITSCKKAIAAIEAGKKKYWIKVGRMDYCCTVDQSREEYEKDIANYERCKEGYSVRELEAR